MLATTSQSMNTEFGKYGEFTAYRNYITMDSINFKSRNKLISMQKHHLGDNNKVTSIIKE